MPGRDELHALVDRLPEEATRAVLAYARQLAPDEPPAPPATARERLAHRMDPATVPGATFAAAPPVDLATLAARQGVRPVTRFEDLLGDIWPAEEDVDAFVAALRRWRRDGAAGDGE